MNVCGVRVLFFFSIAMLNRSFGFILPIVRLSRSCCSQINARRSISSSPQRSSKESPTQTPITTDTRQAITKPGSDEICLEEVIPYEKNSRKRTSKRAASPVPLRFYASPLNATTAGIMTESEETDKFNQILSLSAQGRAHNETVSFTVYGEPMPLARHRSSRLGFMYNPSQKFQKQFLTVSLPHLPSSPFAHAVEAEIDFFFPRPKSHFGSGKNAHVLKKDVQTWPVGKSDVDNLVKFVLDALNGHAFEDDSQVISIRSRKFYTQGEARTVVTLKEIDECDAGNS